VYIEKEDAGLLLHSLLAVIRVESNILDAKYLAYYINAHSTQRILKQDVKGTAIPMLKTKDLEQLKVTIPPIKKQKELIKFLEFADKERELLLHLADEKKQLSQTILDTIIQQNKEDK
jgi:restriction endonuclease S subunit